MKEAEKVSETLDFCSELTRLEDFIAFNSHEDFQDSYLSLYSYNKVLEERDESCEVPQILVTIATTCDALILVLCMNVRYIAVTNVRARRVHSVSTRNVSAWICDV
jgi:hypothetical protein